MASKGNYYRSTIHSRDSIKLEELNAKLPRYIREYLAAIRNHCEVSSTLSYAADILYFLNYLKEHNPEIAKYETNEIPVEMIRMLTYADINIFLSDMRYKKNGEYYDCSRARKSRMLSSISAMFKYLRIHRYIAYDPTEGAEKIREKKKKQIEKLESDEAKKLVNTIADRNETNISKHQQNYEEKTYLRDAAIITLFLNTGVRVSELVGMNIEDVDFDSRSIIIVRKGGEPDTVFFNEETKTILQEYLTDPNGRKMYAKDEENALFLSMRKNRMSVSSVQAMMHKYGNTILNKNNLSPHKLRKTYGTELYNKTGDVKLVADILGHDSINTTSNYYIGTDKKTYGKDFHY